MPRTAQRRVRGVVPDAGGGGGRSADRHARRARRTGQPAPGAAGIPRRAGGAVWVLRQRDDCQRRGPAVPGRRRRRRAAGRPRRAHLPVRHPAAHAARRPAGRRAAAGRARRAPRDRHRAAHWRRRHRPVRHPARRPGRAGHRPLDRAHPLRRGARLPGQGRAGSGVAYGVRPDRGEPARRRPAPGTPVPDPHRSFGGPGADLRQLLRRARGHRPGHGRPCAAPGPAPASRRSAGHRTRRAGA